MGGVQDRWSRVPSRRLIGSGVSRQTSISLTADDCFWAAGTVVALRSMCRPWRCHHDGGSYDYTVVAAQTACEVLVLETLTDLLKLTSGGSALPFATAWFEKNNRTPSLRDERLRDLWNALAADQIQETEWWSAYQTHVVRRHGVVHRGHDPSRREAQDSLQAAHAFIGHVAGKVQGILEQGQQ